MEKIQGFGKTKWSAMMGGVSFELIGTGAHVIIRPTELSPPLTSSWPGEIGQILTQDREVTDNLLLNAIPTLCSAVWSDKPAGILDTVECFAIVEHLRVAIVGHIENALDPTGSLKKVKHAELRRLGEEFIAMLGKSNKQKNIALIYLNPKGETAFSGLTLMQVLLSLKTSKIIVVGHPNEVTNQMIASFSKSDMPVVILKELRPSDNEQLVLSNNVTAFMAPPINY